MKRVLFIIFTIVIISCNEKTPKEIFIEKVSNELKKTLNDPHSFEFVSLEENIEKFVELNDALGDNAVDSRIYDFNYRAKNAYGALVLSKVTVLTDKDFLSFSIQNN